MSSTDGTNPLAMSPNEMRQLGYKAVDKVVEHLASIRDKPATRKLSVPEAKQRFGEKLAADPVAPSQLLDEICDNALSSIMHLEHPRFFGYIPGPSSFVGVIGELLTAGFNIYGGTWLESSVVTHLELQASGYLADCCGFPDSAGGIFLSGGSMANLSALAVARYQRAKSHQPKMRVYCSTQTHSSVGKALRILGFAEDQLRQIDSDGAHRLDATGLSAAVTEDEQRGLIPLAVVGNAGTTNSGAVDPLPELAQVCRQKNIWLHVDAAYGGGAVVCPMRRKLLNGIELADSIALDPHKWLFQPYGIGCLLVRDKTKLTDLFGMRAAYLSEMEGDPDEVNLFDLGPELTRPSRGLRLWFSLRTLGQENLAAAVNRGFENAERAQQLIEATPDWEVVTPAQMGIVTFRYAKSGDDTTADKITLAVVDKLIDSGTALVSATHLGGRPALRMCPINPATQESDIAMTLAALSRIAEQLTR